MPIVNQPLSFLFSFAFAGALYFLLGAYFWKSRWAALGAPEISEKAARLEKIAIGLALFIHATALRQALFGQEGMQFSFSLAFSLMAWLATLMYWLESFQVRMDGMQAVILPAASFAAFFPVIFPESHPVTHIATLGFRLHFLAAMLAYGLFALAAAHALFMALLEKRLRHAPASRLIARMPPLLALETLLFRMLNIAFMLLTLALFSGLLYSEKIFGRALTWDHKTIFGILAWCVFAVLLAGRHIYGWRGRQALKWTFSGFGILLLAYVGSHFVLEVILQRL
ncbi:MAG: cytochrome c biogenesis protein CcsA [Zoogloeaceae bacterium]|jgi:ABC-type uncharacterized transport system permease subunit|nr:cytochrome c biogenesis protein CcsA [Zoogloeaceae bacterium]